MRGTGSADIGVASVADPRALPDDALALMRQSPDLFARPEWWDVVVAQAMPPGTQAAFVLCRAGSRLAMVAPMLRQGRRLASLTTPYTCLYAPVLAEGLEPAAQVGAMRAFAAFCRPSGVTRLDAVAADWPGLPALHQGARDARLRMLRFSHFGNWHEPVAGLDWGGYLSRRPGALRETIRRRLRRADALPGAAFRLLSAPDEMDAATAAFETVYARSWKQPEPFPAFNTEFMRTMAAAGLLRFGLWSIGDTPVAVQIWVVCAGRATVLKLAHDEAFKAHSPGTVLTALMLRHLLNTERVNEIDFGRGDDDYKQGWAAARRQRIGVLLVNPLLPSGALALVRHGAGRLRHSRGAGAA